MFIKLNVAIRVPSEAPREFDLSFNKAVVTIGRDRENDIQIPLSTVSRRHARIYQEQGDWFIEDLRSTHGTKVNGQILGAGGKKLLRDGDQIQVIHAYITFHEADDKQLEEAPAGDEQTSVVARKMVQDVLSNLETSTDTPHLTIMNGPLQGKKIDLGPNVTEVVFGRGENCDVRLDDVNISRRHARVRRDWNDVVIEDLGSKNGIIVSGHKISGPTRLKDADEIYLGAVHLTFVDPTANILGRLGDVPAFAAETAAGVPNRQGEAGAPVATDEKTQVTQGSAAGAAAVGTDVTPEEANLDRAPAPAPAAFAAAGMPAAFAGVESIPSPRFGAAEYTLVVLAVLVVVGLIVGVALVLV